MKYFTLFILISVYFLELSSQVFTLSQEEAKKISMQIWKNECNGTVEGLTSWHANEQFPSLGIGHFIWFPQDKKEIFSESFPLFIEFAKKQKKYSVPHWLLEKNKVIACPWSDKSHFDKEFNGSKLTELRKFLVDTVDLQIQFIVDRFSQAFNKIITQTPLKKRAHVRKQLRLVAQSPNGWYPLIDYVNFKGSGVSPSEKYNGQGWGLLQVLLEMSASEANKETIHEFVTCANKLLRRRVENAPKEKHEDRFLKGWENRLKTYLEPL